VQGGRHRLPVITVTHDFPEESPAPRATCLAHSLDTVKLFYRDAVAAGFTV